MTITKLTTNIQPLTEVDKINELVDGVNNAGTVKKVNNTSPDSNGNVSISIPTVNNATLTIQKNGTTVKTFTANASSNVTANITVPTQASDINAQATLVSGTNIKTINGNSLLGSGDLTISGGGASRNIGEIIASTIPLTDAGLHLLDGALISGSGVYSAFVTYIAGLYNSGDYTAIFDTEANWQTSVTNYGVCGKFVYNSTNNTVRLPKYNSKIYTGGGTAPVVGNGIGLGLTNGNISGALGDIYLGSNNYTRQNLQLQVLGTPIGVDNDISRSTQTDSVAAGVVSNPEYSGLIALLSNITSSLDGYYYIVVATSAKTDIQVDIDEIATDLNNKADTDLSNVPTSKGILVESSDSSILPRWYRVYSDGWKEQGGYLSSGSKSNTIQLSRSYSNTNYTILTGASYNSDTSAYAPVVGRTKTTTSFSIWFNSTSYSSWWYTCGY